jgi:hypothetical protein
MLPDLNRVIEQVSKEKGIDRSIVVSALEEAMLSAAKKTFGQEKNIEVKFNPDLGEVELFEIKTVVEHVEDPENQVALEVARSKMDPEAETGDELLAKLPSERLGRVAAQAAKQNIIQRVQGAERDIIFNEFKDRKGTLFSGIVQRFERKNLIVNWVGRRPSCPRRSRSRASATTGAIASGSIFSTSRRATGERRSSSRGSTRVFSSSSSSRRCPRSTRASSR